MKKVLLIATVYRVGERIYPIIPKLSEEFEVAGKEVRTTRRQTVTQETQDETPNPDNLDQKAGPESDMGRSQPRSPPPPLPPPPPQPHFAGALQAF